MGILNHLVFNDSYAAVFLADQSPKDERDAVLLKTESLNTWLYRDPSGLVGFSIGGQHAEPVTRWLQTAHSTIAGGISALGGILKQGRATPKRDDSYLFRFPISMLEQNQYDVVINDRSFCFFLPHNGDLFVLTSANSGLQIYETLKILPQPLTGLVMQGVTRGLKRRSRSSCHYDPVVSQVREIMGPISEAVQQRLATLLHEWREVMGDQPPNDLLEWQLSVTKRIKQQVRELSRDWVDPKSSDMVLAFMDHSGKWLHDVSAQVGRLRWHLEDYRIGQKTLQTTSTHDLATTPMMLRAASRYVEDVAHRLDVGENCYFLPVLGERNFLIGPATLDRDGLRDWHSGTFLVQIPVEFRFRLGAFPILAHEVGHLVINSRRELLRTFLEYCGDDEVLSELLSLIKGHPSLEKLNEVERYTKEQRLKFTWAAEALADLLATAAVGSSYIFAMARFAIGTLSEFRKRTSFLADYPPYPSRVSLCISLLNSIGEDIQFRSKYLKRPKTMLSPKLTAWIMGLTKGQDAPSDQVALKTRLGELDRIEFRLRAGSVVDARPVEIVGAIWRAVARKSGYLNEIAAVISVLGIQDRHPKEAL